MLKYLSINAFIGAPNFQISAANKKNRKPREIIDATTNIGKLIANRPPVMVMSFYGSGVKPAVKTIQKSYLSYNAFTSLNCSSEKT